MEDLGEIDEITNRKKGETLDLKDRRTHVNAKGHLL